MGQCLAHCGTPFKFKLLFICQPSYYRFVQTFLTFFLVASLEISGAKQKSKYAFGKIAPGCQINLYMKKWTPNKL